MKVNLITVKTLYFQYNLAGKTFKLETEGANACPVQCLKDSIGMIQVNDNMLDFFRKVDGGKINLLFWLDDNIMFAEFIDKMKGAEGHQYTSDKKLIAQIVDYVIEHEEEIK